MNVRTLVLLACPALGAVMFAATVHAQAFDYRAQRGPALGRVSPAPSVNRMGPVSSAPAYRRPSRVCATRWVRESRGDRVVERRIRTCRDRW